MGLFGGDDEGFQEALNNVARNRLMYENLALPEYDEFNPELYAGESANYELIQDNPLLKSKQLSNLNVLEALANKGLSAEDELGFAQARDLGSQQARGGTQAALADAANRGVAGGGMEFAMREIANQGGAQRSQQAGLEQAAASARQRALAAQAYQSALSQTRGQDLQANSANTDIINRFNQANTNQRNAVGQANTDARNDAFKYNQGLKDKKYQNQVGQVDRIAGINNQQTEITLAEQDAQRKRRQGQLNAIGAIGGAAIGGPAGAAAGGQLGNMVY